MEKELAELKESNDRLQASIDELAKATREFLNRRVCRVNPQTIEATVHGVKRHGLMPKVHMARAAIAKAKGE